MKRQLLWLLLAFTAAGCKEKTTEVRVQVKSLTSAIYASGSLVPEEEYKVVSSIDGYLVKANVNEGDIVQKGQLLFVVDNDVRDAQEITARALVNRTIPTVSDNAPALRELSGRIELARIQLNNDKAEYGRYERLYNQKAVSKSTYEQKYLKYQSSLKEYQNMQRQYQAQELSGDLQLQQARNQLIVAQAQSGVGNLRSFADGTVYEVYKKKGDLVAPNQPIALIGAGKMIAKLLVDEDDLGKVTEGQRVLITMDAFPDSVYRAHVSKIYPLLSKAEQSFRIDAVLDEPLPTGMYGLNLEANILLAENKNVFVLPKAALRKGDSVMIKKGKEKQLVKIKKGLEDDNWVEVTGGIDKNTVVIIEP
ncbi:MAG: secretion protein HlyD family protein [Flavipsychrobacter sp.]|jgi:multidrug resistance efflux pump|nr:secretion protein HlyD family protein [Flavipsychrobacter sp.]